MFDFPFQFSDHDRYVLVISAIPEKMKDSQQES
jgi:hypothetical protein